MVAEQGLSVLANVAGQLPMLLVCVVGIILAVTNRPRYPRASLLVIIALVLRGLDVLIGAAFTAWLPTLYADADGAAGIGTIVGLINLLRTLLETVAWGLMLAAVFSARPATLSLPAPATPPSAPPPSPPLKDSRP